MSDDRPNPGSAEAKEVGCTCPILDNAHGKGCMGGARDSNGNLLHIIQVGCPLHHPNETSDEVRPHSHCPECWTESLGGDL